ncbi:hypothetical protein EDD16DRAFT_1623814 [Pisolithus croceorrhizus]|nr:hypothetical protein EDD16DRAFT_1623814 [Pisolithus croceorrhizus]
MLPFCITLSIPLCAGEGCWLASVVSHPVLNSLVRSVNVYQVVHKYDVGLSGTVHGRSSERCLSYRGRTLLSIKNINSSDLEQHGKMVRRLAKKWYLCDCLLLRPRLCHPLNLHGLPNSYWRHKSLTAASERYHRLGLHVGTS